MERQRLENEESGVEMVGGGGKKWWWGGCNAETCQERPGPP